MFMRHPDNSTADGPFAQVSEEAFAVWQTKGWIKVDEAVGARSLAVQAGVVGADVHPSTEPQQTPQAAGQAEEFSRDDLASFDVSTATPESATKPFLIAVAKHHGVSTGGSKEAILARLQERQQGTALATAAVTIDPVTGESLRDQEPEDADEA